MPSSGSLPHMGLRGLKPNNPQGPKVENQLDTAFVAIDSSDLNRQFGLISQRAASTSNDGPSLMKSCPVGATTEAILHCNTPDNSEVSREEPNSKKHEDDQHYYDADDGQFYYDADDEGQDVGDVNDVEEGGDANDSWFPLPSSSTIPSTTQPDNINISNINNSNNNDISNNNDSNNNDHTNTTPPPFPHLASTSPSLSPFPRTTPSTAAAAAAADLRAWFDMYSDSDRHPPTSEFDTDSYTDSATPSEIDPWLTDSDSDSGSDSESDLAEIISLVDQELDGLGAGEFEMLMGLDTDGEVSGLDDESEEGESEIEEETDLESIWDSVDDTEEGGRKPGVVVVGGPVYVHGVLIAREGEMIDFRDWDGFE